MNEKSESRRVRMTKRLMKDAMLELLEKEELSNITITELCETADVHRSTFYKYYTDPADLFLEIEQDFLEQIPLPPPVLENRKAFRIFFTGSLESSFSSRLVDLLCSRYITLIQCGDEVKEAYIRIYIASGTVGMLREWVTKDFNVSSRKIAEMMYSLPRKVTE